MIVEALTEVENASSVLSEFTQEDFKWLTVSLLELIITLVLEDSSLHPESSHLDLSLGNNA